MKTIYTVLPIYDRLSKQCYERARHIGGDKDMIVPVITPQHCLPSFQWLDVSDAADHVDSIEMIDINGVSTDITTYFVTLPTGTAFGTDEYFYYSGDTLNWSLPPGIYYLKITMNNLYIYYSDWFQVECVFPNLAVSFTSTTYDTFTQYTAMSFRAIQSTPGSEYAYTNEIALNNVETLTVIFYYSNISGQKPTFYLNNSLGHNDAETINAGLNEFTFTTEIGATWGRFYFLNDDDTDYEISDFTVIRNYSEKYLKLSFSHSCNLGDIVYADDFEQVLYLESETMEPVFPYVEKGQENGYGKFIPTWQRQDKNFVIRTLLIPQFIVDVLHRLKLHDTITITDLVGDTSTIEDIEVEHEWQFDDKYYALATLTVGIGEEIVITGCCTAVNDCPE